MTDKNKSNIDNMLDRVKTLEKDFNSPTICSAKWLQSTITLYNGYTHSCHHPSPHKIELDELENNPSAIHNSKIKKVARQEMLDGKQTSECSYCWNIENLSSDHISDRMYKTGDSSWSQPFLNRITNNSADNVDPSYLEIAFDNTCNFKCIYCSPDVSSKWMEEIEQHGPYNTSNITHDLSWLKSTHRMPIPQRMNNPYVDAFWSWFPDLYPKLKTLRITGGEPLLSKHTWRLLEYVLENPRTDLTIAVNTNMGVPQQFITKLIEFRNKSLGKLEDFQVFTSCESTNEDAEYIRYGMNYNEFIANIKRYLSETDNKSNITFMNTFNVLSVQNFDKFLIETLNLREQFNITAAFNRVRLSINYLHWPAFLRVKILPRNIREDAANKFEQVILDTGSDSTRMLYLEEIDQIRRLNSFMLTEENEKILAVDRADFKIFIAEHDQRRNVSFSNTFPSLITLLK